MSVNFRIFWDADIYEELLDGTGITSWNGSGMSSVFKADGCVSVNGTKSNPALQADLFGDWREEVCYPVSDNSALRVFTTTDVTTYKLPTLMHDPVYRSGVAAEQTAYNQPPHIGFYLSEELYRASLVGIDVGVPNKTVYKVGDSLDLTGMTVTGSYEDGSNYDIEGYSVTGFDSLRAGEQTITVSYMGFSKSFNVEVNTDFTVDGSMVTGYNGTADTEIIPEAVNGIEITGIAENALKGTSITKLYVYDNIEVIEPNSIEGIKIYCYEGSGIHIYALEHGLEFELIEHSANDYIINLSFDESEYEGFGMYQGTTAQTAMRGKITYGVGGRNRGGDAHSGFDTGTTEDGSRYLRANEGRFGIGGRQPYMAFADVPQLSSSYDNVVKFKMMIPYTKFDAASKSTECYMTLEDSTGVVDTLSKENLGIEYDTWYYYSLIYHKGSYYRALSDADENLISLTNLGATASDMGISRANFYQLSGTEFGKNDYYSYVALDDLQVYSTASELSYIYIVVKDNDENTVENASVKLGTNTVKTDEDGIAQLLLPSGIYRAEISADGFEPLETIVAAFKEEVTKKLALNEITVEALGVAIDKQTASAAAGSAIKLNAVTNPINATERDFVWSSSNETVATVDQTGKVTAVSEGTAEIKVTLKGFEDVCTVTVYDTTKYEQIPTSIEITGGAERAEIPVSGVNKSVRFAVVVYDQNGVPIKNADVNWSCDKAEVENGVICIAPETEAGKASVTASYGEITVSKDIELVSILEGAEIFVNTTYAEAADIALKQQTEQLEETRGDLTYGSGYRSGGTDSSIGVWAVDAGGGNIYMRCGSAGWSSSGRNSYINIDKAPAYYESGKQYVFETDIMFDKSAPTSITASNGIVMSVTSMGVEKGKWYHYALVYADGQYMQYLFDNEGELVSISAIANTSTEPVSRLNIGVSGESGKVYLDNTSYYAKTKAVSTLTVKVYDTKNNALEGAKVRIGSLEQLTNARGRASFELLQGVYKSGISIGNGGTLEQSVVLSGEDKSISMVYDESLIPTPEPRMSYKLNAVKEGNKVTVDLTAYDGLGTNEEKVIYVAAYKEGRLLSVVSTTDTAINSTAFTAEIPAEADGCVCTAWDKKGKPVAVAKSL